MNPTQAKRLGAYLRRARERAELSQAGLAKRVGVDNSRILRLERGDNRAPAPEFLGAIADELGLDLFELYRRAGYAETSDLPSLGVYLRSKYQELPESASDAITAYAERLARQHGVDLSGPAPGEDEAPEDQPKAKATKKGGTSYATRTRSKH